MNDDIVNKNRGVKQYQRWNMWCNRVEYHVYLLGKLLKCVQPANPIATPWLKGLTATWVWWPDVGHYLAAHVVAVFSLRIYDRVNWHRCGKLCICTGSVAQQYTRNLTQLYTRIRSRLYTWKILAIHAEQTSAIHAKRHSAIHAARHVWWPHAGWRHVGNVVR